MSLVDLDNLQLGFGDLALGLRARRDVLRPIAGQPCGVALQHRQARYLHQMLFVEIANPDQFLLHQGSFLVLGGLLRRETGDLFIQLRNPLA